VLEHLCESPTIKDEELDMMGELLFNLYGALKVQAFIKDGQSGREVLNAFLKRGVGPIDI